MPSLRLPEPLPHQLEVLCHPARIKVVVCGRRWGKTTAGHLAVVEGHGPRRGGHPGALEGATIWWVAPSYAIASMIWRALKRSLREVWTEKSENERRIVLPGGGSVTVKSADNPDSLRGAGLDGVVLDEAAFMLGEAWSEGLRPALSDRRGWAVFLSTPCGQNWFYDLFVAAGSAPGWARWQRPTADNPKVVDEELDRARAELGTYQYSQEFEAQFLTPGGGFFRPEWLQHRFEVPAPGQYRLEDGRVVPWAALARFVVVDLAVSTKTTADYTVIGEFGRTPDGRLLVLHVDRARREGPDIVPAVAAAAARAQASGVWIERTAFQLSLVQEARRRGIAVRELVPDRDKVARAVPATAALEAGRVLFPRGAPWLRDFEAEVLAFPNGPHDDQVDVLSYAVAVQAQLRSGHGPTLIGAGPFWGAGGMEGLIPNPPW